MKTSVKMSMRISIINMLILTRGLRQTAQEILDFGNYIVQATRASSETCRLSHAREVFSSPSFYTRQNLDLKHKDGSK